MVVYLPLRSCLVGCFPLPAHSVYAPLVLPSPQVGAPHEQGASAQLRGESHIQKTHGQCMLNRHQVALLQLLKVNTQFVLLLSGQP